MERTYGPTEIASLREVLDDPVVEALEPRGEQRQRLLLRELLDDLLRQRPATRRERDHAVLGHAAVHRVERRRDDVDAQHHPGAAAVRLVVDLARAERRRVAVAEQPELELVAEHARERLLLREPREGVRDESEDVDAHRRVRLFRSGEAG